MERKVRMLALGSAALTDGFALLGFETYPDADREVLNRVLEELVQQRSRALVLAEPVLFEQPSTLLQRLRIEGGQILITEIPPLHMPEGYQSDVEDLLHSVLGQSALER
ncbi:MAG: V-type ATP synthase subunit F [Pseudomonadota bacterium]|nr:V-type ATP synthase subunit F [Pseudomonadota bacterium]